MVFVKTADCTHVHNSVCMPELTVGCMQVAVHLRKAIGCHGFDEWPSEGGWIVDQVKTADSYYTTAKFVFVLVAPFLPWCLVYTSVNKTEYFGPRKIAN